MGVTSTSQTDDAGAEPRVVPAQVGERCVTCEVPMASDQRYCLNCGERRGRSRFSTAVGAGAATQPSRPAPPTPASSEPRRRRTTSGTTLVAGIATLLLAMGVGIEIGRISSGNNNNGTPARASAPSVQVVTVGSGAGGAAAATTASTSSSPKTKAHKAAAKKGATQTVVTKKVANKATQAASKVLGSSAKNLAPATVQQGQSCSSGAGCQGGKFTGNFFGP